MVFLWFFKYRPWEKSHRRSQDPHRRRPEASVFEFSELEAEAMATESSLIDPSKMVVFPSKMVVFPSKMVVFPSKMLVFPIKNAGFPMKNAGFPIKNGAFPIKNGGFPAIYPSNMVVFPIKNAGFPIKNAGFPHQKCWFSSDLPIKNAGFPAVFGMSCRTLSDRRFFFSTESGPLSDSPKHVAWGKPIVVPVQPCAAWDLRPLCFWMVKTGTVPAWSAMTSGCLSACSGSTWIVDHHFGCDQVGCGSCSTLWRRRIFWMTGWGRETWR